MGCDVHVFLERKMGDKPWELESGHKVIHDNELIIRDMPTLSARDYDFFAILGRTRGFGLGTTRSDDRPLIPSRGMPSDVSVELADRYRRDYGHSATFLLPEELKKCLYKLEKYRDGAFISYIWSGKPEQTFQLDKAFTWGARLNNSSLLYIEREKANNELENMITGDNRELQFRYVIWFDS